MSALRPDIVDSESGTGPDNEKGGDNSAIVARVDSVKPTKTELQAHLKFVRHTLRKTHEDNLSKYRRMSKSELRKKARKLTLAKKNAEDKLKAALVAAYGAYAKCHTCKKSFPAPTRAPGYMADDPDRFSAPQVDGLGFGKLPEHTVPLMCGHEMCYSCVWLRVLKSDDGQCVGYACKCERVTAVKTAGDFSGPGRDNTEAFMKIMKREGFDAYAVRNTVKHSHIARGHLDDGRIKFSTGSDLAYEKFDPMQDISPTSELITNALTAIDAELPDQ